MSRILAATLGRLSPRYRTVAQWAKTYDEIIQARQISAKTLANRRNVMRYLVTSLGDKTISSVKPYEIAQVLRAVQAVHPHTAQRVLVEARNMFSEALQNGWVDVNPAQPVQQIRCRVSRKRLTLEQWQQIYTYADQHLPPWVSRMMVLALVTGQRRGDLQKMRFDDVIDGYLHVTQQKTGTMIRLPVALRLDVIDTSIGEAIDACRGYAPGDDVLLRKSTGYPLTLASLSARFETAREGALGLHTGEGDPPSLHECRSLAERLYRAQGIDTRTLLGHARQSMTDRYNDDRGLTKGQWKTLNIQGGKGDAGVQNLRDPATERGQRGTY